MWNSVKRELAINRNGLWQSMLIVGGTCLAGLVAAACILHFAGGEPEFIPMGMILAAITAVVCAVIFSTYYFSCGYEQALKMGCTRGRFLVGALALSAVHEVLLAAAVGLAALVDLGFYRVFYPTAYAGIDWADFRIDAPFFGALALVLAALLCVSLFLGACVQRWGKRAFWILWGVYMASVLLSGPVSSMAERDPAHHSLLGRVLDAAGRLFAHVPTAGYVGLGGALLLVGGVAGAVLLLRGSVKGNA